MQLFADPDQHSACSLHGPSLLDGCRPAPAAGCWQSNILCPHDMLQPSGLHDLQQFADWAVVQNAKSLDTSNVHVHPRPVATQNLALK